MDLNEARVPKTTTKLLKKHMPEPKTFSKACRNQLLPQWEMSVMKVQEAKFQRIGSRRLSPFHLQWMNSKDSNQPIFATRVVEMIQMTF